MITPDEIIEIGIFRKTHGHSGEINLELYGLSTDYVILHKPLIIDIDGIYVPFYAKSYRPRGDERSLVVIEGFDRYPENKTLTNHTVYGLKSAVEEVDPGYEEDMEDNWTGWTLKDTEHGVLGIITDIDTSTSNWFMSATDSTGRQHLVPVHEDLIVDEDPENRILTVKLPQGAVGLND